MKLYKRTDKNMCALNGYEFGLNKTFTQKGKIHFKRNGFHAYESLSKLISDWGVRKNRFFEISSPKIYDMKNGEAVCKKITFQKELSVSDIEDILILERDVRSLHEYCVHNKEKIDLEKIFNFLIQENDPMSFYVFSSDILNRTKYVDLFVNKLLTGPYSYHAYHVYQFLFINNLSKKSNNDLISFIRKSEDTKYANELEKSIENGIIKEL
jgi:hypothetical protein